MSSTIIPTMRYRDAPRMIDWLCTTFGFERHAVHEDGKGGIAHAQLSLGDGMIMLGSAREDAYGRLLAAPDGSRPMTKSPYVVVPDPDAVYARAREAGAEIVTEIEDQDYGERLFSCRDPEGQLWNFGGYDPWKTHSR